MSQHGQPLRANIRAELGALSQQVPWPYAPLLAGAVPFGAGPEPWNATVRQMWGALDRQLKKLEKSKPNPGRPDICLKNARTLDMLVRLYERLQQREAQLKARRFARPKLSNEEAHAELIRRLDRLAAYAARGKPGE